jgi:hypothetical protein
MKAKELREFMMPIDRAALPTVETSRELAERLERETKRSRSIEKSLVTKFVSIVSLKLTKKPLRNRKQLNWCGWSCAARRVRNIDQCVQHRKH